MHMADALVSPAVGLSVWGVSAGAVFYAAKKLADERDEKKAPLMGALGAFVFAAQMINFAIPGTGSSGHIGGGLLLAVLLGPHAAFLTVASILSVQALFFADGGLLALGCNIFNMGFITCYIAYPLFLKPVAGARQNGRRLFWSVIIACVLGLQREALGVAAQVFVSGITALPLTVFLLFMQPVHFAIGLIEGVLTAAVIAYIWRERPEIVDAGFFGGRLGERSLRPVVLKFLLAAFLLAGCLSWFASGSPDGLEWSVLQTAGREELPASETGLHAALAGWQEKLAVFPDYALSGSEPVLETSAAGILGAAVCFILAVTCGRLLFSAYNKKTRRPEHGL